MSREPSEFAPLEDEARIMEVRARHDAELMRYPNVVAVATGTRRSTRHPAGERCIVVYVSRKAPENELAADEVLPREIEGVPVDVVESGTIDAL